MLHFKFDGEGTCKDMGKQAPANRGKYLYAIVAGSIEQNYGSIGIYESDVYTISDGWVSAVISDVPNVKIRPERRHLKAHQEVLKLLMEKNTPLPMSFGIIAESSKAIKKILNLNKVSFLKQLNRVANKVEMGLRVRWDVPNIFEYIITTHQELKVARDRFLGSHREPTQDDKIELGRMFEHILNEDREVSTKKVEEILSNYCFVTKKNKCRNEQEVMNLACLVGKKALIEFESGILKAAEQFDNNYSFDYNGPWAPYNFVEIDLKF